MSATYAVITLEKCSSHSRNAFLPGAGTACHTDVEDIANTECRSVIAIVARIASTEHRAFIANEIEFNTSREAVEDRNQSFTRGRWTTCDEGLVHW